jgi:sugar phosphate isomerase/epimerase
MAKAPAGVELPIVETILYIDPALATSQATHDVLWNGLAERLRAACGERPPRGELQYEVPMSKEYYHSLPRILAGITLDVHAPIQGRDIASPDEAHRRFSVQEYEKIIALAGKLQARAVIIHLTPRDIRWQNGFAQEARREQLSLALASFQELVAYRDRYAPDVLLMPEGLEYPKWWADTAEAVELLPRLQKMDPAVTSCVDVAHLWHNRYLHPASITVDSFAEELAQHLQILDVLAPVEKIHLAGAYIWYQDEGDPIHATHAVPGLAPWEQLNSGTQLSLEYPPDGFRGEWMAVGSVLDVISRFGQKRGNLPPLAMEVHLKDMSQKMQINAMIRTILMRKKAR